MRAAAFACGLLVALALGAVHLAVPSQPLPLGASVTMEAAPSGALAVEPAGVVAFDGDLRPANRGGISATVTVKNQTSAPLVVAPRMVAGHGMLDDVLVMGVQAGATELLHGRLGQLDGAGARTFRLAPGELAALEVRATLPPALARGYQGVEETVRIEFDSRRESDVMRQ